MNANSCGIQYRASPNDHGCSPCTNPRPALPETGFVRLPQILSLIPISRSAWWAGIREGKFPQGIKLGSKTTVWRAEDIRNLIERCADSGCDPMSASTPSPDGVVENDRHHHHDHHTVEMDAEATLRAPTPDTDPVG